MTPREIQILFPHLCPGLQCAICGYMRRRGLRLADLERLATAAQKDRVA